jgi:hypothetical protein
VRLLHIIVYVIVLIILIGAAVSYIDANNANGAPVQEDNSAWQCRTMGNGVCGPNVLSDMRFQEFDEAFNCFAEISYTEPRATWRSKVMRCIPPVNTP